MLAGTDLTGDGMATAIGGGSPNVSVGLVLPSSLACSCSARRSHRFLPDGTLADAVAVGGDRGVAGLSSPRRDRPTSAVDAALVDGISSLRVAHRLRGGGAATDGLLLLFDVDGSIKPEMM